MVVEQVENVAEVVEKVATAAEKLSAQVAEKFSNDSKLKKAALVVEHVSEITAQDAHATTEIIHQVVPCQIRNYANFNSIESVGKCIKLSPFLIVWCY